MDTSVVIRIIAGLLFAVILGVLVMRRKNAA
jgi:LPXTG-motif cell wall-anchored protein